MSLQGSTLYDRQSFITSALTQSISGVIYQSTVTAQETLTTFSGVNTECTPDSNCTKCLTEIAGIDLTSDDVLEQIETHGSNDPNNPGICGGVCGCTMDNVNLTNNVIANFSINLTGFSSAKEQAVAEVMTAIEDIYGEEATSGNTQSNIENMYDIAIDEVANSEQSVSTLQILSTGNFPGVYIKDVTMDIALNAVLTSLTDNPDFQTYLDDILDGQVSQITDFVDTTVTDDFKYAWDKVKIYVYVFGGIIIGLIIVIIIMFVYKAKKTG